MQKLVKNKYEKYRHFGRIYYLIMVISSIITVIISFLWANKVFPFAQNSLKSWNIVYAIIVTLFSFAGLYVFMILMLINSFVYKLEHIKEINNKKKHDHIKQKIQNQSKWLDILAFDKSLSYNLYLTSKSQ
ncbi:hypothetical protein EG856_03485 [Mycoplasmopsis phocirhinis]|uniref:DUF4231 domain-containing protein n=1 Tax=Mycoplasmopsis phocirhinis TaxID=142650 RepID=A0A4V0ZAJ8_9BACT|nr:hypothetical protein [Mycoplasmopsis phocirhinis]QBF34952.1 hypothetical protein EG856_03485 [Mycoplasmopsis phocirhinis]